jgi:ubiquinone/menaquinone biosynthesis C-methylase UbiE
VPETDAGRLLDIGTGTGRVLELLAPRISQGIGVDASKAMLALARARLARPGLGHCSVRLADMYRLPFADASFDRAVLQMVLHYAEDPPGVLAEVGRVLQPGGQLIVIDLAQHERDDLLTRLAHRWPGFSDETMQGLLAGIGMQPAAPVTIDGTLTMQIWAATAAAQAAVTPPRELVV